MKAHFIALLALLSSAEGANFTYDKRNLGDFQKLVLPTNETKAI